MDGPSFGTCCRSGGTSGSSGTGFSSTSVGAGPRPQFTRFSYIEKAEYWALVWGSGIMIVTGVLLWADNWFVQWLPQAVPGRVVGGPLLGGLVGSLAILVWHLYSTVFSPHVYPMNPSWITGTMPEEMYEHEHPGHLEEARRDTEEALERQIERVRRRRGAAPDDLLSSPGDEKSDEHFDPASL